MQKIETNEMFTYVPNPDTEESSKINIFLPHIEIYPSTLISLIELPIKRVKTEGFDGYSNYFRDRWEEHKTFISVEQDIVVWPGAIKQLWNCDKPWCAYDFHLTVHQKRNLEEELVGVPIGCVKISHEAIAMTPNIWDKSITWDLCEQNITKELVKKGLRVHQHYPGVVNANPEFLKLIERIQP